MEYRDNDTALQFYKHAYYDIVAIIHNIHASGDVEYSYRDLNALLEENKINSISYETNT